MKLILYYLILIINLINCQEIIELTDKNFEINAFGKPNKYSLVYFYSEKCTHCQNLNPHFNPLFNIYNNTNLQIFKIDGLKNKRIRKLYNLFGFPTLKLFASDGTDLNANFKGIRTTDNLVNWIDEITGIKPNYDNLPNYVINIKSLNEFNELIYENDSINKDIILIIYQPFSNNPSDLNQSKWDDKNFNSNYIKLANYYQDYILNEIEENDNHDIEQDSIIFSNLDASLPENNEIIRNLQVSKFPTLFHFKKGRSINSNVYRLTGADKVTYENVVNCLSEVDVGQELVDLEELKYEVDKLANEQQVLNDEGEDEDEEEQDEEEQAKYYKLNEL
ncbi:hypothetical protein B5S31_g4703 [[Candida] boidinii]|uniref:Unnamed protein product n=1 Tax=Candida boidinii TaxID=5477 RepID=A0ACB5TFJ2_CANBO|nr:hypothetical protein B5S31_g4703 [[Candida] boidinii]OWB79144.1 hypothetical protein B5S32_g3357 [[Candida] boidinii]GME87405.1 unnamed protein product [[Candida] boidinii]